MSDNASIDALARCFDEKVPNPSAHHINITT